MFENKILQVRDETFCLFLPKIIVSNQSLPIFTLTEIYCYDFTKNYRSVVAFVLLNPACGQNEDLLLTLPVSDFFTGVAMYET